MKKPNRFNIVNNISNSVYFHINSHRIFFFIFLFLFLLQLIFWYNTEKISIKEDILQDAPNKKFLSIISFGDQEFLFRLLVTKLQNTGDVFAGNVPLSQYNYKNLYDWMKALDDLNYNSNLVPSLAAYYYSHNQNSNEIRHVIKYLDEHVSRDINKKWWWLFQSVFIAKSELKDLDLSLYLAKKLATNEASDAPLWTKEMPAFIAREKGDDCLSFSVISNLIAESESGKRVIKPEEMDFMRYFIKQTISNLKKKNFNPYKCTKK